MSLICLRLSVRLSAKVKPPRIPTRVPNMTIPILTAERNRVGSFASSKATLAPDLPSFDNCCNLDFRDDVTAISEMARRPPIIMSEIIINISNIMADLILLGTPSQLLSCLTIKAKTFVYKLDRKKHKR